jgi:arylsulfatase A-like enzyme
VQTRTQFLGTLGAAACWRGKPHPARASTDARRPPNVVLVLTDDQGYGGLVCLGNPILQTPNIDSLYGQSVRLTAHIDLLPTLIALCGLPKPKDVKFDGTSLMPLLRSADADWLDRILVTDSQRLLRPRQSLWGSRVGG